MLLFEISTLLTEDDLLVINENQVFDEIKKIVSVGLSKSMEKMSHDIHAFATQKLHSFDRATKEFSILNKIIANPKSAVTQLVRKTFDTSGKTPTLTKEV